MASQDCVPSKRQVDRAGKHLVDPPSDGFQALDAHVVLNYWRSLHVAPLNVFQNTLRRRLQDIDSDAIVAQRLKREPSIVGKLKRFRGMKLSRMQDIGGIRAVVGSLLMVNELRDKYVNCQHARFLHELVKEDNYILRPKDSGYRSIHLVYRYRHEKHFHLDGL